MPTRRVLIAYADESGNNASEIELLVQRLRADDLDVALAGRGREKSGRSIGLWRGALTLNDAPSIAIVSPGLTQKEAAELERKQCTDADAIVFVDSDAASRLESREIAERELARIEKIDRLNALCGTTKRLILVTFSESNVSDVPPHNLSRINLRNEDGYKKLLEALQGHYGPSRGLAGLLAIEPALRLVVMATIAWLPVAWYTYAYFYEQGVLLRYSVPREVIDMDVTLILSHLRILLTLSALGLVILLSARGIVGARKILVTLSCGNAIAEIAFLLANSKSPFLKTVSAPVALNAFFWIGARAIPLVAGLSATAFIMKEIRKREDNLKHKGSMLDLFVSLNTRGKAVVLALVILSSLLNISTGANIAGELRANLQDAHWVSGADESLILLRRYGTRLITVQRGHGADCLNRTRMIVLSATSTTIAWELRATGRLPASELPDAKSGCTFTPLETEGRAVSGL